MNGGYVVFILETAADECIGILDAINEIASSLNHALVYELFEWFGFNYVAEVIKEFVPET